MTKQINNLNPTTQHNIPGDNHENSLHATPAQDLPTTKSSIKSTLNFAAAKLFQAVKSKAEHTERRNAIRNSPIPSSSINRRVRTISKNILAQNSSVQEGYDEDYDWEDMQHNTRGGNTDSDVEFSDSASSEGSVKLYSAPEEYFTADESEESEYNTASETEHNQDSETQAKKKKRKVRFAASKRSHTASSKYTFTSASEATQSHSNSSEHESNNSKSSSPRTKLRLGKRVITKGPTEHDYGSTMDLVEKRMADALKEYNPDDYTPEGHYKPDIEAMKERMAASKAYQDSKKNMPVMPPPRQKPRKPFPKMSALQRRRAAASASVADPEDVKPWQNAEFFGLFFNMSETRDCLAQCINCLCYPLHTRLRDASSDSAILQSVIYILNENNGGGDNKDITATCVLFKDTIVSMVNRAKQEDGNTNASDRSSEKELRNTLLVALKNSLNRMKRTLSAGVTKLKLKGKKAKELVTKIMMNTGRELLETHSPDWPSLPAREKDRLLNGFTDFTNSIYTP